MKNNHIIQQYLPQYACFVATPSVAPPAPAPPAAIASSLQSSVSQHVDDPMLYIVE